MVVEAVLSPTSHKAFPVLLGFDTAFAAPLFWSHSRVLEAFQPHAGGVGLGGLSRLDLCSLPIPLFQGLIILKP